MWNSADMSHVTSLNLCLIKVPKHGALDDHEATTAAAVMQSDPSAYKATGEDTDDTAARTARLKTEMRDLGREYEREQEELAELAGAGSLVGARSQQEHTTQGHGMMFGRRVGSRDVEASVLPERR